MSFEHILNKTNFDGSESSGDFRPVQVGRMICGDGHVVGKHTHLDWFELTVITDGEGIIETNGEQLEISRGDRSISEIALLLGYSSVYAFSKAFKDETGVSPTTFYKTGG